jgi:5-methylcytosine-specific restriction enzyme A
MQREPVRIHKRKTFSAKDRARIFLAHDGICGISGVKIGPDDDWQVEHRIPIALGGTNDDENLYPALVEPHKGKTRNDVKAIAKCKRIERKADPVTRKPARMMSRNQWPAKGTVKIPSRPFRGREK